MPRIYPQSDYGLLPSASIKYYTCRRREFPLKNLCTTASENVIQELARDLARVEQIQLTPNLERAHTTHKKTLADTEHEYTPLCTSDGTDLVDRDIAISIQKSRLYPYGSHPDLHFGSP